MIKVLIENDENGNRMKVVESENGSTIEDLLNTIGAPLMHLVIDSCDYDYDESTIMLKALLDAYIESNGIGDDIK